MSNTKKSLAYPYKSAQLQSRPLVRYQELWKKSPHLFASKGSFKAGELELILDLERIKQVEDKFFHKYARSMDDDLAFTASRTGVLFEDPYWIILREAVVFPNGDTGLFDRYVSTSSLDGDAAGGFGLAVMPNGNLLLIREFRHQERTWRLGLPGGFRDAGENIDDAVQREVQEETKHHVAKIEFLGRVDADFETTPIYVCVVDPTVDRAAHVEPGEAIDGVVELPLHAVKAAIVAGYYTDASGRKMVVHGPLAAAILMLETNFPQLLKQTKS